MNETSVSDSAERCESLRLAQDIIRTWGAGVADLNASKRTPFLDEMLFNFHVGGLFFLLPADVLMFVVTIEDGTRQPDAAVASLMCDHIDALLKGLGDVPDKSLGEASEEEGPKSPGPDAFIAWFHYKGCKKSQKAVAELLSISQGEVSKRSAKFQAYLDDGGCIIPDGAIAADLPRPKITSVDPSILDRGKRTDGRKPKGSDLHRADDPDD